jgi:hypothetical protein
MGNFSKTTSLRVNPMTRPKLSVETFNNLLGNKPMQRSPSGSRTGNSSLLAGGVPLTRSRSHNSAMDDTKRVYKEEKHPLQHNWLVLIIILYKQ